VEVTQAAVARRVDCVMLQVQHLHCEKAVQHAQAHCPSRVVRVGLLQQLRDVVLVPCDCLVVLPVAVLGDCMRGMMRQNDVILRDVIW
jgi:hypothetical protein